MSFDVDVVSIFAVRKRILSASARVMLLFGRKTSFFPIFCHEIIPSFFAVLRYGIIHWEFLGISWNTLPVALSRGILYAFMTQTTQSPRVIVAFGRKRELS